MFYLTGQITTIDLVFAVDVQAGTVTVTAIEWSNRTISTDKQASGERNMLLAAKSTKDFNIYLY